jgi:hypothetical protein
MRGRPDPDLVLVDAMLAPPPLEDARRSLEYWERRRRALPVYRRAARREARELAERWKGRVRAAERVQFESSVPGRILKALGLSYIRFYPPSKRGLLAVVWTFAPRRLKVVALGLVATWLLVLATVLIAGAALWEHVA